MLNILEIKLTNDLTIGWLDKDGDVEINLDNFDANISIWVNKNHAEQIINHLKQEFGL